MTKQRWRGSLNSFSNHIDPQKEEQLRWMKIEIEEQVKMILKITRNINHGNKERNLRKKSEAIQLIEDFHKQYESLYSLYVDLREQVKKKVGDGDDNRSSSSDSGSDSKALDNDKVSCGTSKASDNDNQESEASDLEDTILKDKSTSSSEVKKIMNPESESPLNSPREHGEVYKDLAVEGEESENKTQMLAQIKDLEGQVDTLRIEVTTLSMQRTHLEEQLECKSSEAMQMEEKISKLEEQLECKSNEAMQMEEKISKVEEQLECKSSEAMQMEEKLSKLEAQILEMTVEYKEKESEFNSVKKGFMDNEQHYSSTIADMHLELNTLKDSQTMMLVQIKPLAEGVENLKSKLESFENENRCLQMELETLRNDKKVLQMELDKGRESSSQLEKISRTNIQLVERKIEELAAEFRKQYDDQYRILSRRITVAEQLQVESKEWYRKTREKYEQETKDVTERAEKAVIELKSAEGLTLAANELLTSLDSQALKFEECSANLVNRISKASCELNFAKQWAMRKNEALLHVKDDLDCLLAQLDEKEAEILTFREKVWKSEIKVRELEETIKEREDEKLELNEEKREAIRQLCVWIDYHRGRSDFYKKILSDMNTRRRTSS